MRGSSDEGRGPDKPPEPEFSQRRHSPPWSGPEATRAALEPADRRRLHRGGRSQVGPGVAVSEAAALAAIHVVVVLEVQEGHDLALLVDFGYEDEGADVNAPKALHRSA